MTSSKLSLILGLVVIAIIILFTLVSITFILTGNAAQLESSRNLNLAYALLSLCSELIAIVGLLAGVYALIKRQSSGYQAALGAALNLIAVVLFFPATLALLFSNFTGLLDNLLR